MRWQFFTTSQDAWRAMQQALREAQQSIYLESYIFLDDEVGHTFVDILVERAMAGVQVRLVLDGVGSFWFSTASLQRLRRAGAQVLAFQSLALSRIFKSFRRLFYRNHRKILIVDRRVGFIGGVNVRKEYAHWLDLHLQIEGEHEVAPLVQSFAKTWILGGGTPILVKDLLVHPMMRVRRTLRHIRYLFSHPYRRFRERSRVRQLYIQALRSAREYIVIATPYFLPDKKLWRSCIYALRRGVRITLLVPLHVDLAVLQYAMHGLFQDAHAAGIDLRLLPTMMHGKAMIVDGHWGTVGSSNIDPRSFFYNHEANITFTNLAMVRALEKILYEWQRYARPFDAVRWRRRSWWRKWIESLVRVVAPIL